MSNSKEPLVWKDPQVPPYEMRLTPELSKDKRKFLKKRERKLASCEGKSREQHLSSQQLLCEPKGGSKGFKVWGSRIVNQASNQIGGWNNPFLSVQALKTNFPNTECFSRSCWSRYFTQTREKMKKALDSTNREPRQEVQGVPRTPRPQQGSRTESSQPALEGSWGLSSAPMQTNHRGAPFSPF